MKRNFAFSLIELMIALVMVSVLLTAFIPIVTKKNKNSSVLVSAPSVTANCENKFSDKCILCYPSKCVVCKRSCLQTEALEVEECSCKSCADLFSGCQECSIDTCKKCKSGYYLENGRCKICKKGHMCDGINITECSCGKYQPLEGMSTCNDCEAGYKCAGESKTICPSGTYALANSCDCSDCSPGSYSISGAETCTPCSMGEYQPNSKSSSCAVCPVGKYNTTIGNSNCKDCEAGYACPGGYVRNACYTNSGKYSTSKSSQCLQCTGGFYAVDGNGNWNGTFLGTRCVTCPAGMYCAYGVPKSCPMGQYQPYTQQSSCVSCPLGQYNATVGNTGCIICEDGYYCGGGSSRVPCKTNCKTCDAYGTCSACKTGYYLASDNTCKEDFCNGANFMKIGGLCVTRRNMGDSSVLAIPSAANVTVVSPSTNCTVSKCCYQGTTSNSCNDNNGGYSGCSRTVCKWSAANAICAKYNYKGYTWRLPTNNEMAKWGTNSLGKGSNGLMLCDSRTTTKKSALCYFYEDKCKTTYDNLCSPQYVWGPANNNTEAYRRNMNADSWQSASSRSKNAANSVRCVTQL